MSVALLPGESHDFAGEVRGGGTRGQRSLHEWGMHALGRWLQGKTVEEAPHFSGGQSGCGRRATGAEDSCCGR